MFLVNLLWVPVVSGWGGDGHRIITDVSLNLLSDPIRRWVTSILDDVRSASVWADTPAASSRYPGSDLYHFSYTPYKHCAPFNLDRDCGSGPTKGSCIVTGLTEAIVRAVDPNISDDYRTDSLKFILHFMADIHQPLHTGFRADSGGLRIRLGYPGNRDLHYVWDTWLIQEYMRSLRVASWEKLSEDLSFRLTPKFRSRLQVNITDILESREGIFAYVAGIASDTSTTATCDYGYTNERGEYIGVGAILTQSYSASRFPHFVVQLLKASVRLGELIEGIGQRVLSIQLAKKEKIRFARQASLFGNMHQARRVDVNYFASLIGEIDLDAMEWNGEEIVVRGRKPTKPAKSKRTTLPVARADEEFLDQAAIAGAAALASYTFEGVNLSQIVLVKRKNRWLVTSSSLGSKRTYIPKSSRLVVVALNVDTQQEFIFDDAVFPLKSLDSDEFIIRTILQIFKIDPRIDLDDFRHIKPLRMETKDDTGIVDLVSGKVQERARADYAEQVARASENFRTLTDFFLDNLRKNSTDIVIVPISLRTVAFISKVTLGRAMTRVRFNRLELSQTVRGRTVAVYAPFDTAMVDPAIFNGLMDPIRIPKLLRKIIDENRLLDLSSFFGHQIVRELIAVENVLEHQTPVSSLKSFQGLYGYYIETDDGNLGVIEWIRDNESDWIEELFFDDPETARKVRDHYSLKFGMLRLMIIFVILVLGTIFRHLL